MWGFEERDGSTGALATVSTYRICSNLTYFSLLLKPPAGFAVAVALSTWSQPLEAASAKRSVSITGGGCASKECQVDGKLITAAAQELWVQQAARLLSNMSTMGGKRALMAL